ncbi:hypothetical protein [Streptomyces sp. NPDC005485]|uniref:hypothetical protein n=1 Tax=Streptomyces sp. NPDC005485 TaxID=3155591 RepID=UPI0033AC2F1A
MTHGDAAAVSTDPTPVERHPSLLTSVPTTTFILAPRLRRVGPASAISLLPVPDATTRAPSEPRVTVAAHAAERPVLPPS